eukprot:GHVT01072561.1.p3 GENE.GHVT01072561.1~~GHVT01072561.1.p3  ORF type:complete len:138 (-),score=40.11 GHVT01072561.1:1087-1500(-)
METRDDALPPAAPNRCALPFRPATPGGGSRHRQQGGPTLAPHAALAGPRHCGPSASPETLEADPQPAREVATGGSSKPRLGLACGGPPPAQAARSATVARATPAAPRGAPKQQLLLGKATPRLPQGGAGRGRKKTAC